MILNRIREMSLALLKFLHKEHIFIQVTERISMNTEPKIPPHAPSSDCLLKIL